MNSKQRQIATAGLLASAGITTGLAATASQAQAEELVVKNTKPKGKGSFAKAVVKANADKDADKIVFASRLSGTIELRGDVEVERPLKIDGEGGAPALTADFRNAKIDFGAKGTSAIVGMELEGIEVVNGEDFDSEMLKVRDSTITGAGKGIGVYLYGYGNSGLAISGSTIQGFEMGVYVVKLGDATITDSRIRDNIGRGGVGANVYSDLEITDSTITGNTSRRYSGRGGGVRSGYESDVELVRTTVTGNDAKVGGGIYAYGDLRVRDSTISGNSSETGGADCAGANVDSRGGNTFGDPVDCDAGAHDTAG